MMLKGKVYLVLLLSLLSCSDQGRIGNQLPVEIAGHKNIILIIIDTLRADHLSCYGYHRPTSPTLDSLARSGILWTNAQAQAPWTLPAHATIWTGLSVKSHGTTGVLGWSRGDEGGKNFALDPALPTAPELFSQAGFTTWGLANVAVLRDIYGFNRGFDYYSFNNTGHGKAAESVDSLIYWLNEHNDERFFCMLHLFDVHDPYDPPQPYDRMFDPEGAQGITTWQTEDGVPINLEDRDHLEAMYDGEIAWVDSNLGRLFSWMRTAGLADNTLIIVTSDHGEEFLEHGGVFHRTTFYQEVVHIPLIMAGPGIGEGLTNSTTVGQFDILPTLLAWSGLESDTHFDGTDILQPGLDINRPIPASGNTPLPLDTLPQLASVVVNREKTIIMTDLETTVSYDLNMDTGENDPLPGDSTGIEKVLYYWATPPVGAPEYAVPDQEATDALRDLGYIDN